MKYCSMRRNVGRQGIIEIKEVKRKLKNRVSK
jgi:hypothetical protein